jgi:hypothetical protein
MAQASRRPGAFTPSSGVECAEWGRQAIRYVIADDACADAAPVPRAALMAIPAAAATAPDRLTSNVISSSELRGQPFQTIRTRMTSQIKLTTPPIVVIRPRSTVAMAAAAVAGVGLPGWTS